MNRIGHIFGVVMLIVAGCNEGSAWNESKHLDDPTAFYKGLKGQKVAILASADYATKSEYVQLELDTARSLRQKLAGQFTPAPDSKEAKEQKEAPTEFFNPASVLQFQKTHPETIGLPIEQLAPMMLPRGGRLVYIEFEEFSAQSANSIMLLKGMAKVTLRVVEVEGGKGYVAFEEKGIKALFPPDAPEGVVASDKVNVRTIYEGVLETLTDRVQARFTN